MTCKHGIEATVHGCRECAEPLREAVIEAAKALCSALDVRCLEELTDVPNWLRKVIEPVEMAVEALQEVE